MKKVLVIDGETQEKVIVTIPDGCVLAVVDLEGKPVGEMLEIKPDFIEGISFSVSHHRRVIQEVKL